MAAPEKTMTVGGKSLDVDHMTKWLEQGSTNILECVMMHANSTEQRQHILQTVEQTNAEHRKSNPHLPVLEFKQESDWPDSNGDLLNLNRKVANRETTLYQDMVWTDRKPLFGSAQTQKDHWIQKVPYKTDDDLRADCK